MKGLTFDSNEEASREYYGQEPISIEELKETQKPLSTLEKVKGYMKFIENIKEYGPFEIALLLAERTSLNHTEVDQDIINQIKKISESYDSLFKEELNQDIDAVISMNEKKINQQDIADVENISFISNDEPDICD